MARAASTPDPLEFHEVSIALGKAKAAWWFLDAVDGDYINFGANFTDPKAIPRNEDEQKDIEGWLRKWCLDNLHDALREAEVAFRKSAAAGELRDEAKR